MLPKLTRVVRPGFAFTRKKAGNLWGQKALGGRSARLVVTMGMPAIVCRWYFRAHSVKSLERNVPGFVGIAPVDEILIGLTGNLKPEGAAKWLEKLKRPGLQCE